MSEIEVVARAIYGVVGSPLAGQAPWWSQLPEDAKNFLRAQAIAAVKALRTPTDQMIEAAAGELGDDVVVINTWTAMIDVILEDGAAVVQQAVNGVVQQ